MLSLFLFLALVPLMANLSAYQRDANVAAAPNFGKIVSLVLCQIIISYQHLCSNVFAQREGSREGEKKKMKGILVMKRTSYPNST